MTDTTKRREELQAKLHACIEQHQQMGAQIEQAQAAQNRLVGRIQVYQEELHELGGPIVPPEVNGQLPMEEPAQ
jgi:hypothetical protein